MATHGRTTDDEQLAPSVTAPCVNNYSTKILQNNTKISQRVSWVKGEGQSDINFLQASSMSFLRGEQRISNSLLQTVDYNFEFEGFPLNRNSQRQTSVVTRSILMLPQIRSTGSIQRPGTFYTRSIMLLP